MVSVGSVDLPWAFYSEHVRWERVLKSGKRVTTAHDALAYQIIGIAMAVHRGRGPGFREDTYQRELETAFSRADLTYESQKLLEVCDSGEAGVLVGYYVPDFIVDGRVVVEIKALSGLDNSHMAQVIGYLTVTGCPVGLLINFGQRSLVWRRILPPRKVTEHRINRQWLFVPEWIEEE